MKDYMNSLDILFQSVSPRPRAGLQTQIWSRMEAQMPHTKTSLFFWRNIFVGSAIAFSCVLMVGVSVATRSSINTSVSSLNHDLVSLEQEMTNDPVIADALRLP